MALSSASRLRRSASASSSDVSATDDAASSSEALRLTAFSASSLDASYRWQLHAEPSLGVDLRLVGAAIDAYCGYENYHVEHHDFPELPMYLLPRLRRIAPEHYEPLRSYSVLDPNAWVESATGEFFYACQDTLYDSE